MRLSERGFTWFYWVRPDLCGDRFPSWPQSSPPPVGPMLSMFATEHARSHMGEEGRPGRQLPTRSERRNKCHATSNRCLTSSNNKLLGTSASLLHVRCGRSRFPRYICTAEFLFLQQLQTLATCTCVFGDGCILWPHPPSFPTTGTHFGNWQFPRSISTTATLSRTFATSTFVFGDSYTIWQPPPSIVSTCKLQI